MENNLCNMLACMELSSEITMIWVLLEGNLSSEWLCVCISYYFMYFQEYLLSMVGCYYLWKAEAETRDMKLCWINECLKHEQNINILCTKMGWPSRAQISNLSVYMRMLISREKTWMGAKKFWEKEIILYIFLLRDLCCPQRQPSWKDNYFLLWLIFEDCLS